MMNSRKIFDDSELRTHSGEEEFIPIEHIWGKLLMIGAADDTLWDAGEIYPPHGTAPGRAAAQLRRS